MEEKQDPCSEVTFKFYLPYHRSEVYLHTNAQKMHSILWDIKDKCRTVWKYEDDAHKDRVSLAEEIAEMIYDEINLDETNG